MSDKASSTPYEVVDKPYVQLFIILMGVFMAVLDTSVVNVAIPKMEVALNANTTGIQWVLTGYMLVLGIIIPTSGWLTDKVGPKKLFLFAIIIFTSASFLCGMAWNLPSIIFFRVLQGIGGGLVQPVAQTIIYRIFPREKMGGVMGLFGITIMAAPAFGPLLSGYFVDYANWRLIFYINIPIGIAAIILGSLFMHEFKHEVSTGFDTAGLIFSTVGFFALLYGFNNVPSHGWGSTIVRVSIAIGVASLIALVITELKVKNPLLNLRVLNNYTFTMSIIIGSVLMVALFVGIFLMPLYLQNIMGFSAMRTGLFMTPAALGSAIMMPISGRLFDRFGARPLGIIGIAGLTLTTYGFTFLSPNSTSAHIQLLYILRSMAMGMCMMPIMTAGTNAVHPRMLPQAAAINNTIRQVASGLGTAILTVYMTKRATVHQEHMANQLNPASPQGLHLHALQLHLQSTGLSPGGAHLEAVQLVEAFIQKTSFVLGMNDTFMISTLLATAAWILTMFIYKGRRPSSKKKPQTAPAVKQEPSLATK